MGGSSTPNSSGSSTKKKHSCSVRNCLTFWSNTKITPRHRGWGGTATTKYPGKTNRALGQGQVRINKQCLRKKNQICELPLPGAGGRGMLTGSCEVGTHQPCLPAGGRQGASDLQWNHRRAGDSKCGPESFAFGFSVGFWVLGPMGKETANRTQMGTCD